MGPAWMASHPEVMSVCPFDGVCLRIYVTGVNDFLDSFCLSGTYDVDYADVQGTIDDYNNVSWGSLTDNFLYYELRHGGTGFANLNNPTEWGRVLQNVRVASRVAAECGFKGIWFDTEDYQGPPFAGYSRTLVK